LELANLLVEEPYDARETPPICRAFGSYSDEIARNELCHERFSESLQVKDVNTFAR